jgi:hypothetical protein
MFSKVASSVLLGAGILSLTNAECPNACSSHGVCSNYDMCMCYRNWMANDCSERVCQFGLAHVDTPKGDLDASSGVLTGPGTTVIVNSEVYPYGTTEQFPNMLDSAGNQLTNTAHYYMECSNKGLCDRGSGTCECFEGYEGSACQRASCPADCSGHGVCSTIKEIARNDNGNIYELWDEDITLGCECDAGYYGPDCSLRRCKYGADPLYLDDGVNSPRLANWTMGFSSDGSATDARLANLHGSFAIVFYDVFGEDWRTDAIAKDADCNAIVSALEALPNDVVASNSVQCLDQLLTKHGGTAYLPDHLVTLSQSTPHTVHLLRAVTLVFSENVGVLKQPEIDMFLDGDRASIYTEETDSSLKSFVFADGFHGEFDDYVPDHCENVLVTLTNMNGVGWLLDGLDTAETNLLKTCIGDANGNTGLGDTTQTYSGGGTIPSQTNDIYDWDHGSVKHPHLIKLVQSRDKNVYTRICNATATYNSAMDSVDWCENYSPAGFYLPMIYDSTYGFRLFGLTGTLASEISTSTEYHVFTTTGTLIQIGFDSEFTTDNLFTRSVYYENININTALGKDCETMATASKVDPISGLNQCLDKGDRVMFFFMGGTQATTDINQGTALDQSQNAKHHNIYTIDKISVGRTALFTPRTEIVLDMGINFGHLQNASAYKFYPPTGASWAKECSDRGNCNTDTGLCECFSGYTHDDCSVQNTLAK